MDFHQENYRKNEQLCGRTLRLCNIKPDLLLRWRRGHPSVHIKNLSECTKKALISRRSKHLILMNTLEQEWIRRNPTMRIKAMPDSCTRNCSGISILKRKISIYLTVKQMIRKSFVCGMKKKSERPVASIYNF